MSSGGGRNGVVKMAALKEERSYGLSCGRVGGRVSIDIDNVNWIGSHRDKWNFTCPAT